MPWDEKGEGYTTKRGGFVKNPKQYEKLRAKGMSKEKAAAIVNKGLLPITRAEIEKASQPWSEEKMKKHTQASAVTSLVGGGLGLAALGAKGAGPALRKVGSVMAKPKVVRAAKTVSGPVHNGLLTAGAGIGGAGSLNFAALQAQKAKQEGRAQPIPRPRIRRPRKAAAPAVAKAYTPFNAEQKRHQRNKVEAGGLAAGGVGAMAGAGYQANKARTAQLKINSTTPKIRQLKLGINSAKMNRTKAKRAAAAAPQLKRLGNKVTGLTRIRNARVGRAGALAAVGAAGLYGAKKLQGYEHSTRGKTYSPQYRPPR